MAVKKHVAYVGYCANLRQRATVWEYHLRRQAKDPAHKLPASGLPVLPSDDWLFCAYPHLARGREIEDVRDLLKRNGYTIVNPRTRIECSITYRGKTQSLAEHAADAGLAYNLCYKRWQRGKKPDEIFRRI